MTSASDCSMRQNRRYSTAWRCLPCTLSTSLTLSASFLLVYIRCVFQWCTTETETNCVRQHRQYTWARPVTNEKCKSKIRTHLVSYLFPENRLKIRTVRSIVFFPRILQNTMGKYEGQGATSGYFISIEDVLWKKRFSASRFSIGSSKQS